MYNRSRHPSANGNGHVENRDIEILMDMVQNQIRSSRLEWMRNLFDPRRNIADECGYPENGALGIEQYRFMWEREPIAARVVELMPRECWCVQPTVYEEEDGDTVTAFEKAWDALGKTLRGDSSYKEEEGSPVWEYLKRVDELSGIGSYGVLLLGFDDRPANMWTEEVKRAKKLLYVRCLDERLATISQWEDDPASPRYGQPKVYTITLADPTESSVGIGSPSNVTLDVHWSRVIHIADGLATNEVLGIPRQRPVFNRILDLYKLYGGSAEMHWKGAFNGIAWGTHPQLGGEVDIDPSAMRDQMEQYFNGQQKYLVGKGMTAQTLSPNVADPSPFIQVQLEAICIKLEVPMRIFMGSERGELASSQDEKGWKKRVSARQRNYLTPRLIVPFVDRLIKVGILPKPTEGYCVHWPDMFALSESEQADIGLKRTQALAAYTQGGCDTALPLDMFFTLFLGMEDEDAQAILDKLLEQSESDDNADVPDSPLLGLVGGLTGVIELYKAAKEQALTEEQLRGILKTFYKLDEEQIDELIADGIPEPEPEPVAPTLPMKVGEGQALIHPETGQTIGKGPPKTFPPQKKVANSSFKTDEERKAAFAQMGDDGTLRSDKKESRTVKKVEAKPTPKPELKKSKEGPLDVSSATDDWVDEWSFANKVTGPDRGKTMLASLSDDMIKEMGDTVPNKPVKVYRAAPRSELGSPPREGLRSWTTDRAVAEALAEGTDRAILSSTIKPHKILAMTDKLSITDQIGKQGEVIVAYGKTLDRMQTVRGTKKK